MFSLTKQYATYFLDFNIFTPWTYWSIRVASVLTSLSFDVLRFRCGGGIVWFSCVLRSFKDAFFGLQMSSLLTSSSAWWCIKQTPRFVTSRTVAGPFQSFDFFYFNLFLRLRNMKYTSSPEIKKRLLTLMPDTTVLDRGLSFRENNTSEHLLMFAALAFENGWQNLSTDLILQSLN